MSSSKRVALVVALSLVPFTLSIVPYPFSLFPLSLSAERQAAQAPAAAPKYDLLLRGGHVIDARNKISAVRDVAIAGGKIAAVEAKINPADALKTVDVAGLY